MDKEAEGLEGMAEDGGCLGVVGGSLVKLFDGGHLPSLFWNFKAIKKDDQIVLIDDRTEELENQ